MVKNSQETYTSEEHVQAEDTFEPLSSSADGRRNAHYHSCKIVEQLRPYAGCLNRMAGGGCGDEECLTAIRKKVCPAIGMRQQEELQGRAIYFTPRGFIAGVIENVRQWVMPSRDDVSPSHTRKSRSEPVVPAKRKDSGLLAAATSAGSMTYADAINRATGAVSPVAPSSASRGTSVHVAPLAPAVAPHTPPVGRVARFSILPGESPLQAARRHASLKR